MSVHNTLPFAIIPEWLIDSGVSDKAVRLYAVLARYADKETLHAYPSRRTLADRLNASVKSVDRALTELVKAGAVHVDKRFGIEGQQNSNDYILTPGRDTDVSPREVVDDAPRGVVDDARTRAIEREPIEREKNSLSAREAFVAFWMVYPRHEGRAAAEKALTKALTKVDIATITVAAAMYRDDPNREPGFTLHGSTWLNQERWNDDPLPVRRHRRVGQSEELLRLAMEE